jgi:3-oxocholest-4-en-26-oyl-CoA dehydrogenase beta subunit
MDFSPSEAQAAVTELSRKLFTEKVSPAALKAVERDADWFDRNLWADLASTGLLGTAVPESAGGSGHGLLELYALLEEAGAAVAPVPLWATLVLGALPVAEFGPSEMVGRLLPGVASGETILTAALAEEGNDDPAAPGTTARRDGEGWFLRGAKMGVPAAHVAERVLVPARVEGEGVGVFAVDPRGAGVSIERQITTTGEPLGDLVFADARVGAGDVLVGPDRGADAVRWMTERAIVGLCAMELGVTRRALQMTASYTSSRHQFERPIATFQAVAQRAADAYIDVECIRLATMEAAWRLASGLPASAAVAAAKLWAGEAGHRVVYAAQHLHAGIGFDREYPLHRYYLWSRQIGLTLGTASTHLARLGAAIAAG